jgi:diadenosine tetraphosphate (Ap4A) HIT family hydrolase
MARDGMTQGCLACDANEGRVQPPGGVILEDDHWILEHSLAPVLLRGWLILKPRRHVEHIADLTLGERSGLGPLIADASAALKRALGAERVYVCSLGESVNHVHFYLIPRYAHMPANGMEVLNTMFSPEHPWACDDQTAADAAAQVRAALASVDL